MIAGGISDFKLYWPYVHPSRVTRFEQRFSEFDETYAALLGEYYPDLNLVMDAPNVTLEEINEQRALADPPLDPLSAGWLGVYKDGGEPRWPMAEAGYTFDPPPAIGQIRADTMCVGLAYWQMVAITYIIGYRRIRQFGYFGRPPKNGG